MRNKNSRKVRQYNFQKQERTKEWNKIVLFAVSKNTSTYQIPTLFVPKYDQFSRCKSDVDNDYHQ